MANGDIFCFSKLNRTINTVTCHTRITQINLGVIQIFTLESHRKIALIWDRIKGQLFKIFAVSYVKCHVAQHAASV